MLFLPSRGVSASVRPRSFLSWCFLLLSLLLLMGGCLGDGTTVVPEECANCPERCLQSGDKARCVECLNDKQCASVAGSNKKCVDNICICGKDDDCPSEQFCLGKTPRTIKSGGCVQCKSDAHCKEKTPEKPVCDNNECISCRAGTTRSCDPSDTPSCKKGTQTCKSNGTWGACKDAVVCKPTENCDRGTCVPDCPKPAPCKVEGKVCTSSADDIPGSYKVCTKNANGCFELSDEKDCKKDHFCEKGSCLPFSCPSPECKLGESKCIDDTTMQTCVKDAQGCLKWSKDTSCQKGEKCYNSSKKCSLCEPKAQRDCYSADVATKGVGVCKAGKQTCSDDGTKWGDCKGELIPSAEKCNGLDDDCDGKIDNNLKAPACKKQTGDCKTSVQRCDGTKGWLSCEDSDYKKVFPHYEGKETRCDGKDNDCDGTIDEGCPCKSGETQACGSDVGACKKGTQTCDLKGQWSACVGEVKSSPDLCDGKDNDCDGKVDEDYKTLGDACKVGKGLCENSGKMVCKADGSGTVCDAKAGQPSSEKCDSKDNDCDGVVDEGCSCNYNGKSKGVCATSRRDSKGVCIKPADYSTIEKCDGKDNNCDGVVDEGCSCNYNGKSKGVCATAKRDTKGVCIKPVDYSTTEKCDGKDNNCDGVVDEGCSCNYNGKSKGVCATSRRDSKGVCVKPVDYSTTEKCDGKDNNCDGVVDEGCPCNYNGKSKGVCGAAKRSAQGQCLAPSGYQSTETNCDGKDNDCDGITDESCKCNYKGISRGVCGQARRDSKGACIKPADYNLLEVCDGKDNDCNGFVDENLNRSCYDGPSGTKGVGRCKGGMQTCSAGKWSACTGQVLPLTCKQQGANCGQIFDGCGRVLKCGTCSFPTTCGGTGTPNVCGCNPAWNNAIIASMNNIGSHTSSLMDSKDNYHLLYYDQTRKKLMYATRSESGSAWTISAVDSAASVGEHAKLVRDRFDNLHAVYHDAANKALKYATLVSGSSTWKIKTIDSDKNNVWSVGHFNSLAVDSKGRVHVMYAWLRPRGGSVRNDQVRVFYATGTFAGTWKKLDLGSTDWSRWGNTALVLDSKERVHLAHSLFSTNIHQYRAKVWYGILNTKGVLSTQTAYSGRDVGRSLLMFLDVTDTLHLFVTEGRTITYRTKRKFDARWSSGSTIHSVSSPHGVFTYHLSGTLDAYGGFHVSYYLSHYNRADTRNFLGYLYKAPNSSTWSKATLDSNGDVGEYNSLVISSKGNATVFYYDRSNGDLKMARRFRCPSSCTPLSCSSVQAKCGQVFDGCGKLLSCGSTCSAPNTCGGGTAPRTCGCSSRWQVRMVDSLDKVGSHTNTAIDAKNNLHVVYYDEGNKSLKYATRKIGLGQDWSTSIIDSSGSVGLYAKMFKDSKDNLHVAYYDSQNHRLKYAYLAAGSSFWTTRAIDFDLNKKQKVGLAPNIYADSKGKVYISYLAINDNVQHSWMGWPSQLKLAEGTPTTLAWKKTVVQSAFASKPCLSTDLTMDSKGNLHMAYSALTSDNRGDKCELRYGIRANGVWTVEMLGRNPGYGEQLSLVVDALDNRYVAFYYAHRLMMAERRSNQTKWTISSIAYNSSNGRARTGQFPSLVSDNLGGLHIAFYVGYQFSGTFEDLVYMTRKNGSSAWQQTTIFTQGDVGRHPSIALDAKGNIYVSFYNFSDNDLGMAILPKCAP